MRPIPFLRMPERGGKREDAEKAIIRVLPVFPRTLPGDTIFSLQLPGDDGDGLGFGGGAQAGEVLGGLGQRLPGGLRITSIAKQKTAVALHLREQQRL